MVATITISRRHQISQPKRPKILNRQDSAINHAVRLIHAVCGLAGSATWIDDIRADLRADKVQAAIRNRDTAVVFDWLMAALSYQGIADAVAYDYMERHGRAAWRDVEQKLGQGVSVPNSSPTGISMPADTKRPAGPVPSPSTLAPVPCRAMTCGMATSTRPPTPCFCSSATLPTAI